MSTEVDGSWQDMQIRQVIDDLALNVPTDVVYEEPFAAIVHFDERLGLILRDFVEGFVLLFVILYSL